MANAGLTLRSWGFRRLSSIPIPHHPSKPTLPPPSTCRRRLTTTCAIATPDKKSNKKRVLVISGPTGAGKTRLALELARRLNGEIISADSVQVYKGLDVGSAKPPPSDREVVPHHLIDILDPSEDYSAGQFYDDARQATEDIFDRGHVPIVAGGTGLYLRWYIYGKPEVPKASSEIGSEVWSELMLLQKNGDWDAAVELLDKAGDPKAQSLARNDWYRLRRSLEIIKASGSPPSAFNVPYNAFKEQLDSRFVRPSNDAVLSAANVHENFCRDLDYEFLCYFLSSQRVDLYRHIDLRCEEMLTGTQGLLSEAAWLLESGLLPNTKSATRAIGYRQAMEYLLRCRQQGGQSSPAEFGDFLFEFQKASRNFAKRQMTWFRNEHIYQWLDASQPLEKVLNGILDAYYDHTGKFVLPESLRMEKDVSNRKETYDLKAYRTRNRLFVRRDDCSHILDWIWKTQRGLASVNA